MNLNVCKQSQSDRALLERGKSNPAGAILLTNEVLVELSDAMHNPEKELPVHSEMASKCLLTVQWIVDEVVGGQHAIAFGTLPLLALFAMWCRATALRRTGRTDRRASASALSCRRRRRRLPLPSERRASPRCRSPSQAKRRTPRGQGGREA